MNKVVPAGVDRAGRSTAVSSEPALGAPLRVLHVIPSISRASGGPAHAIRAMEAVLCSLGCDVVTATTDDDGPGGRLAGGGERAPTGALRRVFALTTLRYKTSLGLWRYLRSDLDQFDVVHSHGLFSFAPLAAAWWARRRGVPYVMRPLGVLNRYGRLGRKRHLKAASLRWVEGPLLAAAAAVHFTAAQEETEARECGIPMRSIVLPLGIEEVGVTAADIGRAKNESGRRWLLFMSRIDPKKNLEACIEAMSCLPPGCVDVGLLICGDGDAAYVDGLRELARRRGVESRIEWAGHISGADKQRAFSRASIFVLPSYSENFGIAAAEALSAGLPCVLGRGVALADEVEAAGAGLAIGTGPEDIVQAIVPLLEDPEALAVAGRHARELWAERFAPHVMGERLMALYRSLARPRAFAGAAA